ncbi:hypothetical protein CYB_1906 [Synechococcus sp. JA-2-3B'a(2-13)]|nr:hypothetical protein CYB_1906 [Synechococcus sp. JA-2-3B'a(2-13)]
MFCRPFAGVEAAAACLLVKQALEFLSWAPPVSILLSAAQSASRDPHFLAATLDQISRHPHQPS